MLRMLLFTVACLACTEPVGPGKVLYLYMDPSLSALQRHLVEMGAGEWTVATDGFISFNEVASPALADVIVVVEPIATLRADEKDPHLAGITKRRPFQTTRVIIASDVGNGTFERVARHEVGHAIGAAQHLPPGNVMAADEGQQGAHITCADVRDACRAWDSGCVPTDCVIPP